MGAADFRHIGTGTDAKTAFNELVSDAQHEHGHGGYSGTIGEKGGDGYVMLTDTPLLEAEAHALADRYVEGNVPGQRWTDDKWGPAGCIPIIRSTREVRVKDFTYVHDSDWRYTQEQQVQPSLLDAVTQLVKLRKGESIKSVALHSYSTPNRTSSYYGGSHRPKVTYTVSGATVTIKKPPATRNAPICIEIPAGLDWEAKEKEIAKQVATMRIKAGEKIISHRITRDTPGKAKVVAVAPKGATETRYIIKTNCRRTIKHATWEDGAKTQAEARAYATAIAENDKNWEGWGDADEITFEVESVTRRVDGQPLVAVRREVGKRIVDVDVLVKLPTTGAPGKAEAWLFFGSASS